MRNDFNLKRFLGAWRFLLIILVAAAMSSVSVVIVMNMEIFGYRIPSPNISIDYLKGALWSMILLIALQLLPFPNKHKTRLSAIWILKIFVTLGAMLIYEKKYILDAYTYYKESVDINAFHQFGFFDGTLFIGWLGHTINQVIPYTNSYHALKVIWAFIGLMAIYTFFLTYAKVSEKKINDNLFFFALFPSVLFWTSILGKDPVAFFGISIFALGVAHVDKKELQKGILLIVASVLLLSLVRFWLAPLLLIGLTFYGIFTSERTGPQRVALFLFFGTLVVVALNNMFQYLEIYSVNDFVTRINYFSRSWSQDGSSGQAPPSFNSTRDLLAFIPVGSFTALFRPLPGEVNNLFGLLAGLENLFVLILFSYSVRHGKGITKKYPLLIFVMAFIGVWSIFYGFISYQNLGTAFRFRLQVLPLVLLLFILIKEREDLTNSTKP